MEPTKKLTICFTSKIPFLIPSLLDDSFHHAIYAIMRQPVGDTKKSSKPVFNNFKNMQKKFRWKFKLLSIKYMSSPIFYSFFVSISEKERIIKYSAYLFGWKRGVIGNHVLNFVEQVSCVYLCTHSTHVP